MFSEVPLSVAKKPSLTPVHVNYTTLYPSLWLKLDKFMLNKSFFLFSSLFSD